MIAAHGAQKVFGIWGGPGLGGQLAMMDRMNFWPRWFWGPLAAFAEFGGGLSLALGLLWPLGPLALIATMLMAILKVHWSKGFWNGKGGIEFPLTLLVIGLTFGIVPPGPYSLDALIHWSVPAEPELFVAGLILVAVGILIGLNSASIGALFGHRDASKGETIKHS